MVHGAVAACGSDEADIAIRYAGKAEFIQDQWDDFLASGDSAHVVEDNRYLAVRIGLLAGSDCLGVSVVRQRYQETLNPAPQPGSPKLVLSKFVRT